MSYHLSFDLSFTQNTFPGKYYALEGIDGSGKTTQAEKLANHFKNLGKDVLITKEPTESFIGQLIKDILRKEKKIPPLSLQYLFAADRVIHLEKDVLPALKKGKIVISDRSFWSSVAYGMADLLSNSLSLKDRERLMVSFNILSMYHGFLVPNKTFVISVSSEVAMQRIGKRDLYQTLYEQQEKLNKVQKEYAWLEEKFPEYLTLINGTKSMEEVFLQIVNNL